MYSNHVILYMRLILTKYKTELKYNKNKNYNTTENKSMNCFLLYLRLRVGW